MMVCIDPGHGMDNRSPGVFDPGCVEGGVRESTIVLGYAQELERECSLRSWSTVLTRRSESQSCPLRSRLAIARRSGADVFISLHANSAERAFDGARVANPAPNGTEVCYSVSKQLAGELSKAIAGALRFRDRGAVYRSELAVLKTAMPAALIELGFQSNPNDRATLLNPASMRLVAQAICGVLATQIRALR